MLATQVHPGLSPISRGPTPQFRKHVKDALENLYDPVHLGRHPLARLLIPAVQATGTPAGELVQKRILDTIEQLKPADAKVSTERPWRTYRILRSRYVMGLPFREVMSEVCLSQTQYHREQRHAIESVATLMWESQFGADVNLPPPVPIAITKDNLDLLRGATGPKSKPSKVPRESQEYIWITAIAADPFYEDGKRGWQVAASSLGVKARIMGPQDANAVIQLAMVEDVVAGPHTAGILVYPLDYAAMDPVLREARQSGIAVVLGNSDAEDSGVRDAFVGPVNAEIGVRAADVAADLLGGHGQVGVIGFFSKSPRERAKAFERRIRSAHPGIEFVGIAATDGSIQDALATTDAFLSTHADINLIYIPEARNPRPVGAVVQQRGLSDRVFVIGTDKSPLVLEGIADGSITATVVQDTYSEEFIALHYLYWQYNGLATIPDNTIIRSSTDYSPTFAAVR
jgi:ribose transport system substrate-binding protein